jgi:putative ABC transport system permease protein/lipoprotein-releasing system permease protein
MNPLSPLTYYRRHLKSTLLLLTLVALMTLGVSVMVRLPDSFLEHMAYSESVVTHVSLVSAIEPSLAAEITAQIRAHPGVARVIRERGLDISLPPISGSYHFFAVAESELSTLLAACDLRLLEGRLPQPHAAEIALSKSIARGVNVGIGDEIRRRPEGGDEDDWFAAIPAPFVVVGILEGTVPEGPDKSPPVGLASYEYVNSHEAFVPLWAPGLVVIAHPGQGPAVERFLQSEVARYAKIRTYRQLADKLARLSRSFHLLFGVVDVLVACAIALVVSIINQLAQSRRLAEFGILNAIGFDRSALVRRIALETAVLAIAGWGVGLALSWGFLYLLKTQLYEPHGVALRLRSLTPIWFSLPIPWVAVALVAFNTWRTFQRLDPIAIVERDKLSLEAGRQRSSRFGTGSIRAGVARSRQHPLGAVVYYLRHRRRGAALVLTISLMLLGVTFPVFVFGPMLDAWIEVLEPLRSVSVVSPTRQAALDPGVARQIRDHPAVQHIVPTMQMQIEIDVPPMAHPSVPIYGIAQADLPALLDVYGVELLEGHLPEPRTNQVVLSTALAHNRGLSVGDSFGRLDSSREDDDLPIELRVVGVLSARSDGQDLWTGFASLEHFRSHELVSARPERWIVVPARDQKAELDAWLSETIESPQTSVLTFDRQYRAQRIGMIAFLAILGILEGVIAVVAAVALAILSYTFFIQRKSEFGVLHAIGHSRRRLVRRTLGESAGSVAIAWLVGAGLCLVGLLAMQAWLYTPKGFTIDVLNPILWTFTLPLPVATITVGTVLIARMLRRLDPVSVIENR